MDIVTYARLNGVLIDRLVEDGRWHRVPTESHPKKRNGAYMSRGAYGFVQDHAAHTEPLMWKPDEHEIAQVDRAAIARQVEEAAQRVREDQQKAANRAVWIMAKAVVGPHPYLAAKGFPEEQGFVWTDERDKSRKLCVPMRVDGRLVGLQTISDQPAHEVDGKAVPAFEKRFLYGQRTSDAVNVTDNKGPRIFCEGYATGLSVRRVMKSMNQAYTLIVCFTAGNLLRVAKGNEGIVIADFDRPSKQHPESGGHGIAVAHEIGLPFWKSDREGEDFNDYETRIGAFRASMALKPLLLKKHARA